MVMYLNSGKVEKNPLHEAVKSGYFYNPKIQGKMRAVAFMSGSGTNFEEIYKFQHQLEDAMGKEKAPFEIVGTFSNTEKGYENAGRIIKDVAGKKDAIKRLIIDPKKDSFDLMDAVIPPYKRDRESLRLSYDMATADALAPLNVNFGILAGYMRLLSPWLVERLACANVHPAPLDIIDPFTGRRRFTGDDAVRDQILAGQEYLQSTVNVAREGADTGEILMISEKSLVDLEGHTLDELRSNPEVLEGIIDRNQDVLKEVGDWDIFPKAVAFAGAGCYKFDSKGKMYFNSPRYQTNPGVVGEMENFNNTLKLMVEKPHLFNLNN